MRSLEPTDHGFVADVHSTPAQRRRRRGHRGLLLIAFIAIAVIVGTQSTQVLFDADTAADEQPEAAIPDNAYEFKVYALNQSRAAHRGSLTQFCFDSGDLPISIAAVNLGDFRKDAEFQETYYGCSGILVNATGSNAVITMRESSGKFIGTVEYKGQDPVVFGSSAWSTSDSTAKTFDGTDVLVIDWRTGNWTPEDGVIVEHPSNVTVSKARLFVMVFAPGYSQEIPEFDAVFASVLLVAIFLVASKRKSIGADKMNAP